MKITEFTELTTVAGTDVLVIVDDPGGTPTTKKITVTNLLAGLGTITHENGGLEFDASGVVLGDLIVGSGTGSMALLNNGTDGQVLTTQADGSLAWEDAIGGAVDALELKASVRVATTANITLSGLQTVDGVSLADGDRILVKDQTTDSENGIYVVDDYGSWSRADDMAAGSTASACFTHVQEGTVNAGTKWLCVNDIVSGVVATGDLVFRNLAIVESSATTPTVAFIGDRNTGISGNGGSLYIFASGITGEAIVTISSLEFVVGGTGQGGLSGGQVRMSEGSLESYCTAGRFAFKEEYDNGDSTTEATIAWARGNGQKITLTGNCTFTFTAGGTQFYTAGHLTLKLIQDATGSRTVTWPASVQWAGGTAPTLSTAAGAVDIIHLYFDGANYYGHAILNVS